MFLNGKSLDYVFSKYGMQHRTSEPCNPEQKQNTAEFGRFVLYYFGESH